MKMTKYCPNIVKSKLQFKFEFKSGCCTLFCVRRVGDFNVVEEILDEIKRSGLKSNDYFLNVPFLKLLKETKLYQTKLNQTKLN